MENHELINRYIYAATKNLPRKTRTDVAKELQSLISDMLEERCGEVLPTDKDVRVVLTELGTPAELASKYSPDSGKVLIGEAYYSQYKLVLKIVLLCAAFGITIATAAKLAIEPAPWYFAVAQLFAAVSSALIGSFGMVTLIFAVFERKSVALKGLGSGLDDLPPVPEDTSIIKKWEAIGGIVLSVVFVLVFLGLPQLICAVISDDGVRQVIPIFNEQALRSSWFIIVTFAVLGIVRECYKLVEGRYTKRLLTVTAITNALTAVLTVIWISGMRSMLHPELLTNLSVIFPQEPKMAQMFQHFDSFLMFIILLALVLDTATVAYRAYRTKE